MDSKTQSWLVACLVDNVVATAGLSPSTSQLTNYQVGLDLLIFGKSQLAAIRSQANQPAADSGQAPTVPVPAGQSQDDLNASSQALANAATISTASLPKTDVSTLNTSSSADLAAQTSSHLQGLVGAAQPAPTSTTLNGAATAATAEPKVTPTVINPNGLFDKLQSILDAPLVASILQALADLEQLIANIQQVLFTLPGLNILASAFYKVCAESATQPLACSVSLPVGIPIPADVTGDNFPDVLAELVPTVAVVGGGTDVGVSFSVTRLASYSVAGPLPAHVFAVYDPPLVGKRIEFGYDGRSSTLANNTQTQFVLHNILAAVTGDVSVSAKVTSISPGSSEALTFAVKDLVGGSTGHPATEANPLAGAVQFLPFPQSLTLAAHLTHAGAGDEDNFSIQSSTPSTVSAVLDQDTTTTTPKSHREFTALIDQLPTSVSVDLKHAGQQQTITYNASAPISHVMATDTDTLDTSHPGSYTKSIYDVQGVPTSVQVTMQGAQDILYTASAKIPQVTFSTQTYANSVLQQEITAQALQIPTLVHVSDTTGADQTAVTYDANDVLPSVAFSMYDLNQDQTNLTATATSIPTHMAFTQTKSTGVYDFSANAGIGRINASLTRGGGMILPLPGDHATVYKRGNALGLDFQLSGFQSAHFDGSQKTIVTLGLNPGGQSFDAIADLDSPNVLATVHVSQLPSNIAVTIDPVGGSATYAASSIIPDLHGTFTQRDTGTVADLTLTQLPKNITLNFNISGAAPQITYVADSRLGSINGFYQAAPNGLSFHAVISDLPQYMHIGGADPIVFDARTAASDPAGSSYLGQVLFDYATDGTFQSPPTTDDHVLLNAVASGTHAELLYTGLQYLSVDTTAGALHAEIRNTSPRLLRAYLTTDTLTLTGFIDKVPADIKVDQVGNDIKYNASSPINEIYTKLQRTGGDAITADVLGVPQNVDLLFDAANSKLAWNASAPTGSISVQAHLTAATLSLTRDFDAALTITGIPASWTANFGNGNFGFTTTGSGIGQITADVTNHTTFQTDPNDHLLAYYNQATGDLDASLQISNLTQASFSKLTDGNGGGFVADLNMGNHGQFDFSAHAYLTGTTLEADGNFTHLPSTIHLKSDGGRIQYNGNDNPTLTLSVGAGDPASLAATPAPANVHGLSIRDGSVGGGEAVRVNLFITGLPDSLDLNSVSGVYTVGNFHPTIDGLVIDAKLTTLTSQPISLYLTQSIGTASPVSFTFGPFVTGTSDDGSHTISVDYTSTRDLGELDAEATYGGDDAQLMISSIPSSISVDASLGDQKSVTIAMSHGISEITAAYRHTGDLSFDASVDLTSVPSSVNLVIGRAEQTIPGSGIDTKTVDAPDFQYNASAAGMNITAMAKAELISSTDIDRGAAAEHHRHRSDGDGRAQRRSAQDHVDAGDRVVRPAGRGPVLVDQESGLRQLRRFRVLQHRNDQRGRQAAVDHTRFRARIQHPAGSGHHDRPAG